MTDSQNSDSHRQYCLNKATPEGSNLYYALLFEQQQVKEQLLVLHAFGTELHDILIECSDPGIARIKFNWWLEELSQLSERKPRHPVTYQMQTLLTIDTDLVAKLKEMVTSYEKRIQFEQPASLNESLNYNYRSYGLIWKLCAELCGIDKVSNLEPIQQMAGCYDFLIGLQSPEMVNFDSRCALPADYFSINTVPNDGFLKASSLTAIEGMLTELQERNTAAAKKMSRNEKQRFLHGIILNRIVSKTIREMLDSRTDIFSSKVSLTPIRKLMLGWWIRLTV